MTILETERLVRKISALPREGSAPPGVAKLAEDFAAACRGANLRLQQCEAMIREGARHQAIQSAETAPNLLDWIAVLEFQTADGWRQYCEANHLSVAERIDARAVASLNDCYAQGISTDHPLYAALRGAVLTHNDEEALRAARSIVRLNPADANAISELDRLDGKVLAAKLQHLNDLVSGASPEVIVAQIEAIEAAGFKNRPEGEAWRNAQTVRCRVLLEEAGKLKAASLWGECLAKLESIRQLRDGLKLQFAADELRKFEELERWATGEQVRDQDQRDFQLRIADLRGHLQPAEPERLMTLAELQEHSSSLRRSWEALKGCRQPIPDALGEGFQRRSSDITEEIARRLAARQRRTVMTVAASVVVGAIILSIAFIEIHARNEARELNQAVADRQAGAAEKLLNQSRHGIATSLGLAGLPAAIIAADDFLARENGQLKNFRDAMSQLPKLLAGEPTAAEISRTSDQLARARSALVALSPDLKAANESQLQAFEQRWQKYLSTSTEQVNGLFEKAVAGAEKETEALTYHAAVEQARNQAAVLSNAVRQLGDYESGFTNHVQVRGELLERSAAVHGKFAAYDRELRKLDDAVAALHRARGIGEYSNALEMIASSKFSSSPWAVAALAIRTLNPNDEGALRSLLNATNSAMWDYIAKKQSPRFIPDHDLPPERDVFEHLSDDPSINANHQRIRLLLDGAGTRALEWITTGPLARAAEWKTIKAYEPAASPNICAFETRQYGFFDGKYKWSPPLSQAVIDIQSLGDLHETAAFRSVGLEQAIGSARHKKSLLEVLDALKDSREGSPLFRAYLFGQLVDIMEQQPVQRGLLFAPEVRAHRATINNLSGGELADGDWFISARVTATSRGLEEFFGSIKGVSYQKQAEGILRLDEEVFKAGLKYVGFVAPDGIPVVVDNSLSGEVFGYPASGAQPALLGRQTDSKLLLSKTALKLSPLFVLGAPRKELLDKAGINPGDPSFAGAMPRLFKEQLVEKTP